MKSVYRILAVFFSVTVMVCSLSISGFAQELPAPGGFSEEVVEVPKDTEFEIDEENGTVTIIDNPVSINTGDTFVVYIQSLPVAYVANSIEMAGNQTVITAEKADRSVYGSLDKEGVVYLTPDMYEFLPAPGVTCTARFIDPQKSNGPDPVIGGEKAVLSPQGEFVLEYDWGGERGKVTLSNMRITFAIHEWNLSLSFHADWHLEAPAEGIKIDLDQELGVFRFKGIGKLRASLFLEADVNIGYDIQGSLDIGFDEENDEADATQGFSVRQISLSGKGELKGGLKLTAGVDILVAEADLYGQVGIGSDYETAFFSNENNPVDCENIRVFVFLEFGVEAKVKNNDGNDIVVARYEFGLPENIAKPARHDFHFENGKYVSSCTQGMIIEYDGSDLGGYTTQFESDLLALERDRILDSSITLPYDLTIDDDLTIYDGTLNLNGHKLTVKGDLLQEGGTVQIKNGILNVYGNYRIQTAGDSYGPSDGRLIMDNSDGKVNVDGDFFTQSNFSTFDYTAGTLTVGRDFHQINTDTTTQNFRTSGSFTLVMDEDLGHTVTFENTELMNIPNLIIKRETVIPHGMRINNLQLQAKRKLTVNGNVTAIGSVNINGGELEVTGNYHYGGGELLMTDPEDIVRIGGDFLVNCSSDRDDNFSAGILYVAGNFTQSAFNSITNPNDRNFCAGIGHKTVLNGTGKQTVNFESTANHFGTLEVQNTGVIFTGRESWLMLDSDIEITASTFNWPMVQTINLYGHKMTVNGNMRHDSAIDINRGTLKINGNLESASEINVNGGKLEVTGNYLGGKLLMTNSRDEVRIGGNFDINSWSDSDDIFTAGNLYVAGNFTQRSPNSGTSPNIKNFCAGIGHRTVLNGNGKQTVDFESMANHFGTLEVRNTGVFFKGKESWLKLDSDLEITASTFSWPDGQTIDLSGHKMTVNGNMTVLGGTVNINGGVLEVNGKFSPRGTVIVNGGELDISGDFDYGSGKLIMTDPDDIVRVGGKFEVYGNDDQGANFTAGTLYVAGDFIERPLSWNSSTNFAAEIGHRTVLNGTGSQQVNFQCLTSHFGTLEVLNTNVTFAGKESWLKLDSDLEITASAFSWPNGQTIDLSGHKMTVNGNMTVLEGTVNINGGVLEVNGKFSPRGTVIVNGGELDISGDFDYGNGKLIMTDPDDIVRIGGKFEVYGNNDQGADFKAGTLYVAGDFIERPLSGNSSTNFAAEIGHRTILNGTGAQKVNFQCLTSHFGTLEVLNSNVTFAGKESWLKLDSDLEITASTVSWPKGQTINLTGHKLTINGNLSGFAGTIDINGGELNVNGNLTHTSQKINVDGGSLTVSGNLSSGNLVMTNAADTVRVLENFTAEGEYGEHYTAGRLFVAGNFSVNGSTTNASFRAGKEHRVILNGTSPQQINIASSNSNFGILELRQHLDQYKFISRDQCWETLIVDSLLIDKNYVVTGYIGNAETLDVPSKVRAIGDESFLENETLVSVTLPQSVTKVGRAAFKQCALLTNITMPDTLAEIGDSAFEMSGLTAVTIPSSVLKVGNSVFAYNTNLTSVAFHENISEIGESAFAGDTSLTVITLPASLEGIGAGAFSDCGSLGEIDIPDGVSIGAYAFSGCTSLARASLPSDATLIADGLFKNCEALASIVVPLDVTSIGEMAFYNCSALAELTIPESLSDIGKQAFLGANGITEITIPEMVTSIGEEAVDSATLIRAYRDSEAAKWAIAKQHPLYLIGEGEYQYPVKLVVSGTDTVLQGKTVTLMAQWDQNPMPNDQEITWTSGNTAIASVTEDGIVTGVKAGKVAISACSSENGDVCDIFEMTVIPLATKISVNGEDNVKTIDLGTKGTSVEKLTNQLTAAVSPVDAGQDVTWSSSDQTIATVSSKGLVTAKKVGTVTITAIAKDGSDVQGIVTINVVSKVQPGSLKLNGWKTVAVGKKTTLKPVFSQKVQPQNQDLTWKSSNTAVATVSEKGVVTAKKVGTTKITATAKDGSKVAVMVKIKVKKPATKVVIRDKDNGSKIIDLGTTGTANEKLTYTLKSAVKPVKAWQSVTWTSSNKSIATVSKGVVTAKKTGTVTIKATTRDGTKIVGSVKITVTSKPQPGSLTITGSNAVAVGKTVRLTAKFDQTVQPLNTNVTWTSSKPAVATVSAKGVVKGIKAGTSVIKACSKEDPTVCKSIKITVKTAAE